jgi:hypothetical protein
VGGGDKLEVSAATAMTSWDGSSVVRVGAVAGGVG